MEARKHEASPAAPEGAVALAARQAQAREVELRRLLREAGPLLVAYSGGVDSSYLAHVAHGELGTNMLAVLAVSPSLARRERLRALAFVEHHGIPYRVVATQEHLDPAYARNDGERCYHCKRALFDACEALGRELGIGRIAYGFHAGDLGEPRPGDRAARESGVLRPLLEAGFDKAAVRERSRALGLGDAERPAQPCLASRLHFGTPVTPENLGVVEAMEALLDDAGFLNVRARFDGTTLRLEADPADLPRLVAPPWRERLVTAARQAGAAFVALDLEGYVSGKLHRPLSRRDA